MNERPVAGDGANTMSTLLIAVVSFFGFIVAYRTYGLFLSRKIFQLQDDEPVPSVEQRDDLDFVPTNRFVIFGHHFTSIAGTGPIVGPAIAMIWGWLPALLWVVFGSIFIGAVHDFTALILSLRNRGQTLGDISGKILSPSARLLFLLLLTFLLAIVVAVFGNVIAVTFESYPLSVIPTMVSIPLAMILGVLTYRYGVSIFYSSLVALLILGLSVFYAANHPEFAFRMPDLSASFPILNPVILWTAVIFVYCYFASVLPVWLLLQPRDYINSLILYVALGLIVVGVFVAGVTGKSNLAESAPAVRLAEAKESGAPPIFPFLFITVACGAVSGFHALVSSGTSSKQVARMKDAQYIGYGAMLLEGALAVIVILSCTAGIGMGIPNTTSSAEATGSLTAAATGATSVPEIVHGRDAWNLRYARPWSEMNLGEQVGIFIEGGANFMHAIGVPLKIGQGIVAILIACFAATTIDASLRLMRYVLEELGATFQIKPMKNRYFATGLGLALATALALCKANPAAPYGTGGMILWPLFGAGNQVVAGLTLLVGGVYLMRRKVWPGYLLIPAAIMITLPLWAMSLNIFNGKTGFFAKGQFLLAAIGIIIILLTCWLIYEAYRAIQKNRATDD